MFISKAIIMRNFCIVLLLCFIPVSVYGNSAHIRVVNDIVYGGEERQKLDIYAPHEQKTLKPVIVHIHGGGWMIGNKKHARRHGLFYADQGIVFVAINYRLSPDVKHPAHVQDGARAVKWVVDNIARYGGDPNNIHVSGHSAGAHLAALLGTDPRYLKAHNLDLSALKTVFPVDSASFDFTYKMQGRPRLVRYMVRQSFGTDRKVLRHASPYHHVGNSPNAPRFVSFVTQERPDAVEQTRRFYDVLQAQDVRSEIYAIPRLTHKEMNEAMYDPKSPIARRILHRILSEQ